MDAASIGLEVVNKAKVEVEGSTGVLNQAYIPAFYRKARDSFSD